MEHTWGHNRGIFGALLKSTIGNLKSIIVPKPSSYSGFQSSCNRHQKQKSDYMLRGNGDWLFITYYVLKSIDHMISIQNMVLQELGNRNTMF